MNQKIAIQVDDLTVAYNYKPVLWDIDLVVPEAVLMAIVGPNGAGKSTLMRILSTLQEADTGQVTFDNLNVLTQKMEQIGINQHQ